MIPRARLVAGATDGRWTGPRTGTSRRPMATATPRRTAGDAGPNAPGAYAAATACSSSARRTSPAPTSTSFGTSTRSRGPRAGKKKDDEQPLDKFERSENFLDKGAGHHHGHAQPRAAERAQVGDPERLVVLDPSGGLGMGAGLGHDQTAQTACDESTPQWEWLGEQLSAPESMR
jgi:hypothetical protein